jgi:hypothetical protein
MPDAHQSVNACRAADIRPDLTAGDAKTLLDPKDAARNLDDPSTHCA